ncbi:MAG TPA: cupredoxin domain-containing protein [Acidimicrobiales bacterium]|nr:cupredoxin domain-containing protein [Acidimicrobiales bacterium]
MITTGAKLWYAIALLAFVAAGVYFVATSGEEYGAIVLAFAGVAAAVLGTTATVVRDGDVAAPAEGATVTEVPHPHALPALWPALSAVGVALTVIGFAAGNAFLYAGLALLGVVLVEWMVQAWAERASSDPGANQGLRNRIMFPLEIPALAVIGFAVVVLAFSRVLLALPQTGSSVVAILIAALVLSIAAILANRPQLSSSLISGIVVLGVIALLGGGIIGAVAGEREFHHYGDDHADVESDADVVISASSATGFDQEVVTLDADTDVTIVFENHDDETVQHNVHIQGLDDAVTEIIPGGNAATVLINAPPGEHTFICDVHPTTMQGTLVAQEPAADDPHGTP